MRFGSDVFRFPKPLPDKLVESIGNICALGDLPQNWDSYGARPIDPSVALAAIRFLSDVLPADTPPPQIVPTSRGGIQLEWHCNGVDLEIDVRTPATFHVSFEDLRSGIEESQTIVEDFQSLLPMLRRLSQ